LIHEGPGSDKLLFYRRIKDVEKRIDVPNVILNSVILSRTPHRQLQWKESPEELENMHVLFMQDNRGHYVTKLLKLAMGLRCLRCTDADCACEETE